MCRQAERIARTGIDGGVEIVSREHLPAPRSCRAPLQWRNCVERGGRASVTSIVMPLGEQHARQRFVRPISSTRQPASPATVAGHPLAAACRSSPTSEPESER